MTILLTGGTGYIGSHAALALINAGHQVILYDNLSNSSVTVIDYLKKITLQDIVFVEGDVRDTPLLQNTLKHYDIDAVMHFSGLKAVGESVQYQLAPRRAGDIAASFAAVDKARKTLNWAAKKI